MSRPLNPNATSFTPNSSLHFHHHHQLIPAASTHVPPSPLFPLDLPSLPHPPPPPHLLQPTCYHHHYPNPNQQVVYGFPPPPPPPPTKVFDNYTLVATLDVYKGIRNHGYCLKKSTKPTTGRGRCNKHYSPPPPPSPPHRRQIHNSTSKKHWRRKSSVVDVDGGAASGDANDFQISKTVKDQLPKPLSSSSDRLESIQQGGGTKTSVMIKNIPNRYCRQMLLDLLVDHCKEENDKEIKSKEDLKESAFDFVYLPIDFETECNKGYAFVNFTNPNGVERLYNSLNYHKWDVFNSKKICEVTYARIQGKEDLIKHFNRSTFACEKDEYLPVYFIPFLDGSVQDESVEVVTVGTRTTRLLPSSSSSSSSQHVSILRRGDQQLKRNHDENEKNGEEGQPEPCDDSKSIPAAHPCVC